MYVGVAHLDEIEDKDIYDAIVNNDGILANVAEQMGICRNSVYILLNKRPHLWKVVKEQRKARLHRIIDKAECRIEGALDQHDDLRVGVDAAKFVLRGSGAKDRGYGEHTTQSLDVNLSDFEEWQKRGGSHVDAMSDEEVSREMTRLSHRS